MVQQIAGRHARPALPHASQCHRKDGRRERRLTNESSLKFNEALDAPLQHEEPEEEQEEEEEVEDEEEE